MPVTFVGGVEIFTKTNRLHTHSERVDSVT